MGFRRLRNRFKVTEHLSKPQKMNPGTSSVSRSHVLRHLASHSKLTELSSGHREQRKRGAPEITYGAASKSLQNEQASPEAQGLPPSLERPGPSATQHSTTTKFMHEIDLGLTMESESFLTGFGVILKMRPNFEISTL